MRDIIAWNKASSLKLTWFLFFQPHSIWATWFRKKVLEGELSKFWIINTKQKFSWMTNKLIKQRELIYDWIKLDVGNGENCRFWTDNWSPFGNLKSYLSSSPGCLGLGVATCLASLWTGHSWRVPAARTEEQLNLFTHLTTVELSDKRDCYEWQFDGKRSLKFHTGAVYQTLKNHQPKVNWCKEVWFSEGIPRHKFLTWMFVLNRCPTKDRLVQWGLPVNPMCLLCHTCLESRGHLFFQCTYSWRIWTEMGRRLTIQVISDWTSTLDQIRTSNFGKVKKKLVRLVWQCVIYQIWTERNGRLHMNVSRPPEVIIKLIDSTIQNRASSLRPRNFELASALLQMWFSSTTRS